MAASLLAALPRAAVEPRVVHAAAWALVHFVWQGALGAGLLWLGLAGCRRARSRYALSCLALLAMAAAPPVRAWWMMRGTPAEMTSAAQAPAAERPTADASRTGGAQVRRTRPTRAPGPIGRMVPRLFRASADGWTRW